MNKYYYQNLLGKVSKTWLHSLSTLCKNKGRLKNSDLVVMASNVVEYIDNIDQIKKNKEELNEKTIHTLVSTKNLVSQALDHGIEDGILTEVMENCLTRTNKMLENYSTEELTVWSKQLEHDKLFNQKLREKIQSYEDRERAELEKQIEQNIEGYLLNPDNPSLFRMDMRNKDEKFYDLLLDIRKETEENTLKELGRQKYVKEELSKGRKLHELKEENINNILSQTADTMINEHKKRKKRIEELSKGVTSIL